MSFHFSLFLFDFYFLPMKKSSIKDFEIKQQIGKGSYSKVYKVSSPTMIKFTLGR